MPPATFPTVLGDFGCDVTCHTCRENSPRTRAITLGSKPPLATRIARTGLGKRLGCLIFLTKYLDVSLCVRPDVMKRYVMGHFLFPGNIDFASRARAHFSCCIHERLMCLFIVRCETYLVNSIIHL